MAKNDKRPGKESFFSKAFGRLMFSTCPLAGGMSIPCHFPNNSSSNQP